MLLFALGLLPLYLVCAFFYEIKARRSQLLIGFVLGVIAGVLAIVVGAMLAGLGLNLDWTNLLSIVCVSTIKVFFIPILVASSSAFILLKRKILVRGTMPLLVFFETTLMLYFMDSIAFYHSYYSYYTLVYFPFIMFLLAHVLYTLFSNNFFLVALFWALVFGLALGIIETLHLINSDFLTFTLVVVMMLILFFVGFLGKLPLQKSLDFTAIRKNSKE